MHAAITSRSTFAVALIASAAAWPSALSLWFAATRTPLERAMASAFCGAAPHAAELHCPACWAGAAALLLGAICVLASPKTPALQRVRADRTA